MSYTSQYNLNIRLSALESKINSLIPVPFPPGWAYDLVSVLGVGNNAGTFDIDMNTNDILDVNNIDLVTINGAAYPPAIEDLQATLTAGNIADLGFTLSDTVGTDTAVIIANPDTAGSSKLQCGHTSSSFATNTEISASSGAVEYLGSVADTGTNLTTKRFLLSNGSVLNRDRATDGTIIALSEDLTDYTLAVNTTNTFTTATGNVSSLTTTCDPLIAGQTHTYTSATDQSIVQLSASSVNGGIATSVSTTPLDIINQGEFAINTNGSTCSIQASSISSSNAQLLRMNCPIFGDASLEHLGILGAKNFGINTTGRLSLTSSNLNSGLTNFSYLSSGAGGMLAPVMTLTNTGNTTSGVSLKTFKNKGSAGIAGDVLFQHSAFGRNSANNEQEYTRITHTIRNPASPGNVDGSIELGALIDSVYQPFIQLNANDAPIGEVNVFRPIDFIGGSDANNTIKTSGTGSVNLNLDATGSVGAGAIALKTKNGTPGSGGGLLLTGDTLLSATAGGNSGQHLCLTIGGTVYKIQLLNA
jgi:hypothetical protein